MMQQSGTLYSPVATQEMLPLKAENKETVSIAIFLIMNVDILLS